MLKAEFAMSLRYLVPMTMLLRASCAPLALTASLAAGGIAASTVAAEAAVVRAIAVEGNQRVDDETVRSYVTVQPGVDYSAFDTDESLQALFATGLFSDVRIYRRGSTLVVEVAENPTINLVVFQGNDKVEDEQLARIVQSQSLGVFSQEKLDSDVERVREVVRRSGRAAAEVTARVDTLENNRVNITFLINEGERTRISSIEFVGNNAYGDRRLSEVITHNESNFLSWLKRDDIFDPDRLRADEERLRRFYFDRGYADFRVISATSDFDADNNAYSITFTVEEGDRYTFGAVEIDNALPQVDADALRSELTIDTGDVYSAREIERSLEAMSTAIGRTGFAFAEITPRGERDFDNRVINITFFVDEGPRTYVERIEVVGNVRTRGYVIRREFDLAEGDPYNRVMVNQAKRRLDALGFFKAVRITTRPGSAPDRVVLVVNVNEQPTGEISFGGGYSTENGPIGEIALKERNFLGRGQYLKVSGGFGEDTQKYELSFTEPYFLGTRIAAGFDIIQETADANDGRLFDTETTLVRLRAAAPITENLRAQINYTYKNEELSLAGAPAQFSCSPVPVNVSIATCDAISTSPYVTSSLGYSLTYSTLDSLKTPREGIYASFQQDFAGVGGDASFIRSQGRATGYYLASEDADLVLVGAVGAGHVWGYNDDLRLLDHYFQGGETIRGFDTRGFGPRDLATNEALGGTTYVNATAEVQFPMFFLPRAYGVRGALFADVGTLYGNRFAGTPGTNIVDDAELRASVGASVLWDSPFGPLRADFAYPIAKADYDEEQFFRFGVSTRF